MVLFVKADACGGVGEVGRPSVAWALELMRDRTGRVRVAGWEGQIASGKGLAVAWSVAEGPWRSRGRELQVMGRWGSVGARWGKEAQARSILGSTRSR